MFLQTIYKVFVRFAELPEVAGFLKTEEDAEEVVKAFRQNQSSSNSSKTPWSCLTSFRQRELNRFPRQFQAVKEAFQHLPNKAHLRGD